MITSTGILTIPGLRVISLRKAERASVRADNLKKPITCLCIRVDTSGMQSNQQKALDVVGTYKACGLDLVIEAKCSRDTCSTAAELLTSSGSCTASAVSQQPGITHVGGHQARLKPRCWGR